MLACNNICHLFLNCRTLLRAVLIMNMWLFTHISLSKDKWFWTLESKYDRKIAITILLGCIFS